MKELEKQINITVKVLDKIDKRIKNINKILKGEK